MDILTQLSFKFNTSKFDLDFIYNRMARVFLMMENVSLLLFFDYQCREF